MIKLVVALGTAIVGLLMLLTLAFAMDAGTVLPGSGGSGAFCPGKPPISGTPGLASHSPAQPCLFGGRIADAAARIAGHLSGRPDVFYDAGLPSAALAYWQRVCPVGSSCWPYWQSGNLQCVQLVTGAFALAGAVLPAVGNAIDFWALYQHRPGWQEIAVDAPGALTSGLPQPGDIMVWASPPPGVGHVAIVLAVQLPDAAGHPGSVTFAEANGPGPIVTESLLSDHQVLTWPGYVVYGYIRTLGGAA